MKSGKKVPLIAAFILVVLVAATGYFKLQRTNNNNPSEESLSEVTVAYRGETKVYDYLLTVAEEKGYFRENGIKIKREKTNANTTALLTSGQADISLQKKSAAFQAFLSGQDLVWTGSVGKTGWDLVSKYPIEDISKVKKVAVMRVGGSDHLDMISLFEDLGVSSDKVEYVPAPDVNIKMAMLEKGEVDACLVSVDYNPRAQGDFKRYSSDEIFKNIDSFDGIITTRSVLSEREKDIKAFVKAIDKAKKYIINNKEEVISDLKVKYEGLSDEGSKKYYDIFVSTYGTKADPDEKKLQDLLRILGDFQEIDLGKIEIKNFVNKV